MGTFIRIFVVVFALGIGALYKNYSDLQKPIQRPSSLINDEYWGPNKPVDYKENKALTPYDISVAPELIADLKAQLSRPLKIHAPLEGVGFEYGFNANELQKIVKYWRDTYLPKWSEREKLLKRFPHYRTEIQGLKIHYLHVKPGKTAGKKVLPLLLMHGWPGTIREFYDFIPLLTTPSDKSDYVFEVIAPSLPGYGWSQASAKTGFGAAQMSIVMRNLMLRVGHKKFYVQGGDWGSVVGSYLAALFPENVLGYHSNMCATNHPLSFFKLIFTSIFPSAVLEKDTAHFYKNLPSLLSLLFEEMGYAHLQATKPDTIGTVLTDNPVGLAAYILEKFSTWTNPAYKQLSDGGLTRRFDLDALLDNVMVYYVTNSITTSQRLYAESMSKAQFALNLDAMQVQPPAGCARFVHELSHVPDFQLKDKFQNLVHSTHHSEGGHFPAFEVPQLLYADFIAYINKATAFAAAKQQ